MADYIKYAINYFCHAIYIQRFHSVGGFVVIFVSEKGGICQHQGTKTKFPIIQMVGKVNTGQDRWGSKLFCPNGFCCFVLTAKFSNEFPCLKFFHKRNKVAFIAIEKR